LHVAFAAGTGILPFVDLVAYIVRRSLQVNMDGGADEIADSFRFWLNVQSRQGEEIGDEFLQECAKNEKVR